MSGASCEFESHDYFSGKADRPRGLQLVLPISFDPMKHAVPHEYDWPVVQQSAVSPGLDQAAALPS